jgi:hypothetical protein
MMECWKNWAAFGDFIEECLQFDFVCLFVCFLKKNNVGQAQKPQGDAICNLHVKVTFQSNNITCSHLVKSTPGRHHHQEFRTSLRPMLRVGVASSALNQQSAINTTQTYCKRRQHNPHKNSTICTECPTLKEMNSNTYNSSK